MADLNFSQSPYWDDYQVTKNYLRILFRPGRAVQAREMTQLQTSLSNQIATLGNNVLNDGTPVLDAKIKINFDQKLFTVDALNRAGGAVIMSDFIGRKIRGATSLATGVVVSVDVDNRIMYIDERGGQFINSEELDVYYTPEEPTGPAIDAKISAGSITTGVYANQESGIYYVNGNFVHVDEQGIPVDSTANDGNYKVGFVFEQTIVTSDEDSSLFDNAVGTPNQTAPGADRFKGAIQLQVYVANNSTELETLAVSEDFHEVVVIRDGIIIKENNTVQYSAIMDTMARRTFDESGNYTIREFPVEVKNYTSDVPAEQDTLFEYFHVGVEPGKGYVQGYEVEKIATTYIKVPRARTSLSVNNEIVYPDIGPWIETGLNSPLQNSDGANGRMIDFTQRKKVWLKSGNTIINPTTDVTVTTITQHTGGTKRVYLQGVGGLLGLLPSVTRIEQIDDSDRFIDVNTARGINTGGEQAPIFALQNSTVREIVLNETTYDTIRYRTLDRSGSTFTVVADSTTIDFPANGAVVHVNVIPGFTQLVEGVDFSVSVDNASSPSRLSITLASPTYDGISQIDTVIRETKRQANHRAKTLTTFSATFSDQSGGVKTLQHTDIYRIVSVQKNGTPLTDNELKLINLDNGQRDYFYDYGILSNLEDGETYEVVYQYFLHGTTGDYFSVNSYTSTANLALIPDLYTYIPVYDTINGAGKYYLSDCLDFRRSVTQLSGGVAEMVVPQSSIRLDYEYYVGRKDKVYIDKNGVVGVKQGIPSKFPESPIEVDDTMLLYNLTVPPYTFYPKDIDIEKITNKRYTMRDIGKLEKRIDTIEYYTSLSLLEQETQKLNVTDASGSNKFKSGILVDNFTGHSVGDVRHPEYRIAIDGSNGVLRAPYSMHSFDLENATGSTNIQFHPNIATLDYSVVDWVKQPLGSEFMNVNPYSVFQWVGNVTLTPSTDNWIDVTRTPDVTVNFEGANDNLKESVALMEDAGVIGTNWNAWQTAWTGEPVRTGNFTSISSNPWQTISRQTVSTSTRVNTSEIQVRNVTSRDTSSFSQSIGERRSGTQIGVVPGKTTESIGDFVVDTSIIPWMRTIDLSFKGTGLKPSTTINATFDGIDVNVDCRPVSGSFGDPLVTDAFGEIEGIFRIPNEDEKRFRTGTRNFRLVDDATNPNTSANSTFVSSGMLQTKQNTIVSMDNPRLAPITVEDERVLTNRFQQTTVNTTQQAQVVSTSTTWRDPLAQSFLVSENTGVFLTGIDLFFKSKDPILPVTVYIVEMDNGYPTQNIIPYSEVSLKPTDVNVDPNGALVTEFNFTDPVYLTSSTEYAFVVISNSNNYEATVGKVGSTDLITTNVIGKQPYTGSLFKSQNSSTWTADQERDLKFTMKRAQFSTNEGTLLMQSKDFASLTGPGINYQMDMTTTMLNVDFLEFSGTTATNSLRMRQGDFAAAFLQVENKTNIEMTQLADIQQVPSEARPILTESKLKTISDYISPVYSMSRRSVVGVANLLEGNDAGRYISRTVNLDNPSDDIKVYLDVLEPDNNTKVNVFFKTESYIPKYVDTLTTLPDYLIGTEMKVFWYDSDTDTAELQGTFNVTNIETLKLYMGQVTDSDAFRNASGSNQLPAPWDNILVISTDDDITQITDFVIGATYSYGDYVFSNGDLYKAIDNISALDTVNAPSPSAIWQLIQYSESVGEIQEGTVQEWRPMVKTTDVATTKVGFTEFTYIPAQALENEFQSFSIKIEFEATNPAIVPFAKNLRALALF